MPRIDQRPHRLVRLDLAEQARQRGPHLEAHRVALGRPVDGQRGHGAVDLQPETHAATLASSASVARDRGVVAGAGAGAGQELAAGRGRRRAARRVIGRCGGRYASRGTSATPRPCAMRCAIAFHSSALCTTFGVKPAAPHAASVCWRQVQATAGRIQSSPAASASRTRRPAGERVVGRARRGRRRRRRAGAGRTAGRRPAGCPAWTRGPRGRPRRRRAGRSPPAARPPGCARSAAGTWPAAARPPARAAWRRRSGCRTRAAARPARRGRCAGRSRPAPSAPRWRRRARAAAARRA